MIEYPTNQDPSMPMAIHEGQRLKEYLLVKNISPEVLAVRINRSLRSVYGYFVIARFSSHVRQSIYSGLGINDGRILENYQRSNIHYGQRLQAYLLQRAISHTSFAARMGKAKSTVSAYMKVKTFSRKNLQVILKALDARYEDVFCPLAVTEQPASIPATPNDPEELYTITQLLGEQLAQWQKLLSNLKESSAPSADINFCHYQIRHLKCSSSFMAEQ
ncbi:helix-turn-helix transcriptional regulator [Spirosoma sp. SC4-14]|uniref:helix-turn-helix domain-containing protein n=1 Tax=Spirosoma sp. SC4-14 TaxID=3128900 RepID=UPI0030D29F95